MRTGRNSSPSDPALPALWEEPAMTRERRKALLRSLIDKVVLRRAATDRISARIVWRGGAVSDLEVAVAVSTYRVLPRGAEMEARLLDLARQGVDDATIAAQLTAEGTARPAAATSPWTRSAISASPIACCAIGDRPIPGIFRDG